MFDFFSQVSPVLILQGGVVAVSLVLLFLLLFTLRDIVLRTHSFLYQAVCVLIVGALPIVGFLLYLLIRPARTIKQRELEAMLLDLLGDVEEIEDSEESEDSEDSEESEDSEDSEESEEVLAKPNDSIDTSHHTL